MTPAGENNAPMVPAELRALSERATRGTWEVFTGHDILSIIRGSLKEEVIAWKGFDGSYFQREKKSNASFIVALVNWFRSLPSAAPQPSRVAELEAEVARLREALNRQQDEICQDAGKALGYPWFMADQKNFPGATENNGVCVGEHCAESIVAELSRKYRAALEASPAPEPMTVTDEEVAKSTGAFLKVWGSSPSTDGVGQKAMRAALDDFVAARGGRP